MVSVDDGSFGLVVYVQTWPGLNLGSVTFASTMGHGCFSLSAKIADEVVANKIVTNTHLRYITISGTKHPSEDGVDVGELAAVVECVGEFFGAQSAGDGWLF